MSLSRFILLLCLALPSYAKDLERLVIQTFEYESSTLLAHCHYQLDWPRSGVSTQALANIRFLLLTDGWAMPDYLARKAGDDLDSMLQRRAVAFAENHRMLETGEDFRFPWEETTRLKYEGSCGALHVFMLDTYEFTGGAHGIGRVEYFVLNATGKRIPTSAWFKQESIPALTAVLTDGFRKQKNIPPDAPLGQNGFLVEAIPPSETFRPTQDGMEFFYNSYEIAPYSEGKPSITVPWRILAPFLTNEAREWIASNLVP